MFPWYDYNKNLNVFVEMSFTFVLNIDNPDYFQPKHSSIFLAIFLQNLPKLNGIKRGTSDLISSERFFKRKNSNEYYYENFCVSLYDYR